jgi:NAD(P)-dependent dehydrogenase (short-subunit alcohol dehydrogenase family)
MSSAQYLHRLFNLDDQVAVVIGGAGELGGAICAGLVQAGAHVVVADLTAEGCQARVEKLQALGGKASCVLVNVTSRQAIEQSLADALQVKGRVEILVNSAGVNAGSAFLEADEAAWDRVMSINLKAVFLACQVYGKHMADSGGGSILNIGSVTSLLPLSRVFAYSASKAGVLNLTRNIAQDLAPQGVRVNCICPGFFPAEQNRKLLDEQRIDNIMRGTPMKRFGTPDELVGAALLLLAPAAGSFITGSAVSVDGGFTCSWF